MANHPIDAGPAARHPHRCLFKLVLLLALIASLHAPEAWSETSEELSLEAAQARARETHPDVVAAREALAAAAGRETQAGAFRNPTLGFSHEQTSNAGFRDVQDIALVEQPLEIAGQRGLRTEVARLKREAAEAELQAVENRVSFETVRAYVSVIAAQAKLRLAAGRAEAFASARETMQRRLREGDVSGYATRRLAVEGARYDVERAQAEAAEKSLRETLSSFLGIRDAAFAVYDVVLSKIPPPPLAVPALEDLQRLAASQSPELRATQLEQRALAAEAVLARREGIPTPIAAAGYKTQQQAGISGRFDGFVAQLSVPLPLWDRREGAIAAAHAEARKQDAQVESVRRRTLLEVADSWNGLRTATAQLEALEPGVTDDASMALRAAGVAYAEGEISLIEWLDAGRAQYELQVSVETLRAEAVTRRAAIERLVGSPIH